MDCPASADNVFGPLVAECRRAFDFTALFEDSFLSIVPSSILLLLAPIRLITLYGKRRTVGGQSFRIAKLLTIVALAVLQTALLVLWCLYSTERTRATIASAALSAVDAVIFCLLSYSEHALSIRPSALLNIYLFFSVLFDAVRARTLWLMNYDPTIRAVFTATLALKVIILFLEVTEKRRFLRVEDRKLSPEETSGILNQSLFVWLNQLIVTGFKKVLLMDDLYPLNQELSTSHLKVKFRKDWNLGK
ncbi:hypothetical protein B0J14DRAFT_496953 [Halenospora varia]|nr:hypothetical protein B0J14DRAFT_496953 [Halenospora varia]